MNTSRVALALLAAIALCLVVMTPFVMAIKYYDWGVGLILVSPLVIWWLLRVAWRLERWARNETETLPQDPDFPDDLD